jgi:hypothetical protein
MDIKIANEHPPLMTLSLLSGGLKVRDVLEDSNFEIAMIAQSTYAQLSIM